MADPDLKQALRARARHRRKAFVATLPPITRTFAFRALPSPVAALLEGRQRIALYIPVGSEAPALNFGPRLTELGKILCVPHVEAEPGIMHFRRWHVGEVIPAPDAEEIVPDAIITPLLAFDRRLTRLGQGGGYYDRVFERFPNALRIGLAWSVQEMDDLPADPWDVPLHGLLTEGEFIEGEQP